MKNSIAIAALLSLTMISSAVSAQTRYYAREKIVGVSTDANTPSSPAMPPPSTRSCVLTAGRYITNPTGKYIIGQFRGYGRTVAGMAAGKAACESDVTKPGLCYVAERSNPADCGAGASVCSFIYAYAKGTVPAYGTYGNDASGTCTD